MKPVALMSELGTCYSIEDIVEMPKNIADNFTIPLYTHPVKEEYESFDRTASHMAGEYVAHPVELTDEEIRELGRMSRKWQDPYVWLAKRINRPLKDLTNKEIQEVITEHEWYEWTLEQFARAILRKAQEK